MLHQLGIAEESSYGQFAVPDRFYEFTSETLDRNNRTLQSDGIRPGGRELRRGARRVLLGHDGAGTVNLELGPDEVGLWLKHLLGDVATTQPDGTGAPNTYTHEFTMGSLRGLSLTAQKGVEQEDQTVAPVTFLGCKIPQATLSVSVDAYFTASFDVDAREVVTSESLASASLVDGPLFHFGQAALLLGGAAVAQVTSVEIQLVNTLKTDRYFLGQAGLKAEPRDDGYPEVTGTLEAEFIDLASLYDSYAADTPLELDLSCVGEETEAGSGINEQLQVVVPEIHLDGQAPQIDGPGIPTMSVPFTGFFDGTSPSMTATLTNTDQTP